MGFRDRNETTFKLLATLGTLRGPSNSGIERRVCLCEWSGRQGIDIRDWRDDGLGTGIFLNEEDVRKLRAILDEIDFGK